MSTPTFFKEPVCLDKEQHRHCKVTPPENLFFANRTDSVAVTTSEFFALCKTYPIAFAQDDGTIVPVALFSMRQDHNAFLDHRGRWLAHAYLPLIIRGYPFYPTTEERCEGGTLWVDNIALQKDSERSISLFTPSGDASDYLRKVEGYFQRLQTLQTDTRRFCAVLQRLDILEISPTQFKSPDGRPGVINRLLTVDREALHALPEEQLGLLAKDGHLECIYSHLNSLTNIETLTARTRSSGARRSQ